MTTTATADFVPKAGTITMFSTGWCGYCARLKQQLTKDGISFTDVNIEEVAGTAKIVESVNGGNQTVPTVIFPDGSSATNPSLAEVKARLAV
jgi:mycoredoxin